jgi:hypothetical protein
MQHDRGYEAGFAWDEGVHFPAGWEHVIKSVFVFVVLTTEEDIWTLERHVGKNHLSRVVWRKSDN